jgi:hypothetical protein
MQQINKGIIYQENITIINVHTPNIDVVNFIKHTLLYKKDRKIQI